MTQIGMAQLFQTSVAKINIHLKNIYEERELTPGATIKDYLIVRMEGSRQIDMGLLIFSTQTRAVSSRPQNSLIVLFPTESRSVWMEKRQIQGSLSERL